MEVAIDIMDIDVDMDVVMECASKEVKEVVMMEEDVDVKGYYCSNIQKSDAEIVEEAERWAASEGDRYKVLAEYTVAQLRSMCKEAGLRSDGVKSVLMDRLLQ